MSTFSIIVGYDMFGWVSVPIAICYTVNYPGILYSRSGVIGTVNSLEDAIIVSSQFTVEGDL